MAITSFEKHGKLVATADPVQAAEHAITMTESVIRQATDWGFTASYALMGTVAFFCLITFFFRRL